MDDGNYTESSDAGLSVRGDPMDRAHQRATVTVNPKRSAKTVHARQSCQNRHVSTSQPVINCGKIKRLEEKRGGVNRR